MNKKVYMFLLLAFLISGCKGNQNHLTSDDIAKKDTLNINIGTDPPSLDWSLATDSTSYLILNNIMEGLTRFGDDYKNNIGKFCKLFNRVLSILSGITYIQLRWIYNIRKTSLESF